MDERFDVMAQIMLNIFHEHGVSNLNITDQVAKMDKRDKFHFSNTHVNQTYFQEILRTSMDIMHYRYVFAAAMHMYESLDDNGLRRTNLMEGSEMNQRASHDFASSVSRSQDVENVREADYLRNNVLREEFERSSPSAVPWPPMPRETSSELQTLATVKRVLPPIAQEVCGEWVTIQCVRGKPQSYDIRQISKTLSRLLRHSDHIGTYADARLSHPFIMSILKRELYHNELRDLFEPGNGNQLARCLGLGCQDKARFQVFVAADKSHVDPLAWRAIQGHTKSSATIAGMNWIPVGTNTCPVLWHGTKRHCTDSILADGLIPGGVRGEGRSEVFFSPRNPLEPDIPADPIKAYKFDAEVYLEVDTKEAIDCGCSFYLSEGGAVLCRETIHPRCLKRILDRHGHPVWTAAKITSHYPFETGPRAINPYRASPEVVLVAPPTPKEENAEGDLVRDRSYALQDGFYWSGTVRCGKCPLYTEPYPHGERTEYTLKRGTYTGEIVKIKESEHGDYLSGFLPHFNGWINLWCKRNKDGVETYNGAWFVELRRYYSDNDVPGVSEIPPPAPKHPPPPPPPVSSNKLLPPLLPPVSQSHSASSGSSQVPVYPAIVTSSFILKPGPMNTMLEAVKDEFTQLGAPDTSRSDAVGDHELPAAGVWGGVKMEIDDNRPTVKISRKNIPTTLNPADSMSKQPPPPPKVPSVVLTPALNPPSPDPADSVPPSVVSEHPLAPNAEGDLEREIADTQPDVESEADYGGTDDEDVVKLERTVDDDQEGPKRPLSEFEERVAVALIESKYDELVAENRCWRCTHIFPTGAHICNYCAAPLTHHDEDRMTINEQAVDAKNEFGLVFHWVLRGAGTAKNPAKRARELLKGALRRGFSSIAHRYEFDNWFRTEKQFTDDWTIENAREMDILAGNEPMHKPMTKQERKDAGFWRHNQCSSESGNLGGGANTNRRQTSSNYKGKNPW